MLRIALKEWSIVCDLLAEGGLAILLRKGGIHEDKGPGVFELEHPRFAFFPSWAHQKPRMIKPPWRQRVQVVQEPAELTIKAVGRAAGVWEVPNRPAFDQLDDLHCWTVEQIDMRFDYKPQRPLYLVAVRCSVLATPRTIQNNWQYGGCKSWVPLEVHDAIDPTDAAPAIDDEAFERIIERIDSAMRGVRASSSPTSCRPFSRRSGTGRT